MNAKDRNNIASVLSGISSGDCNAQVNAGLRLMQDHPKIKANMTEDECQWWGVEPLETNSENVKPSDMREQEGSR